MQSENSSENKQTETSDITISSSEQSTENSDVPFTQQSNSETTSEIISGNTKNISYTTSEVLKSDILTENVFTEGISQTTIPNIEIEETFTHNIPSPKSIIKSSESTENVFIDSESEVSNNKSDIVSDTTSNINSAYTGKVRSSTSTNTPSGNTYESTIITEESGQNHINDSPTILEGTISIINPEKMISSSENSTPSTEKTSDIFNSKTDISSIIQRESSDKNNKDSSDDQIFASTKDGSSSQVFYDIITTKNIINSQNTIGKTTSDQMTYPTNLKDTSYISEEVTEKPEEIDSDIITMKNIIGTTINTSDNSSEKVAISTSTSEKTIQSDLDKTTEKIKFTDTTNLSSNINRSEEQTTTSSISLKDSYKTNANNIEKSTENYITNTNTEEISTYKGSVSEINNKEAKYISSNINTEEESISDYTEDSKGDTIKTNRVIYSDEKTENIKTDIIGITDKTSEINSDINKEFISNQINPTIPHNQSKDNYITSSIFNTQKIIDTENITINYTYYTDEIPYQEIIIEKKINITKEEAIKNINNILGSSNTGENYILSGENYILLIKPSNSKALKNLTNIDFGECEQKIREVYHINNSRILTIVQLESNNNTENSHELTNQIEYQIFDDNKNPLDTSVCKDLGITINAKMNEESLKLIDKQLVKDFQDLNVNIFDINDPFFVDVCKPIFYKGNDIILDDRYNFIYQNFSLCEKSCNITKMDFEKNFVTCECEVKNGIKNEKVEPNYQQFDEDRFSNSNIDVIKCTNLIFDFKNKSKNGGFIIFVILSISFIGLIIFHIYKGIKPVSNFVYDEMKKYNYINSDNRKFFEEENSKKSNKIFKSKRETTAVNKNHSITNNMFRPKVVLNLKRKQFRPEIGGISGMTGMSENKSKLKNSSERNFIFGNLFLNNNLIEENKFNPPLKKDTNKTKEQNDIKLEVKDKNIEEKKKSEEKDNFGIIKINLGESMENYFPNESSQTLHNYTFKEANKYDNRNICEILYIFLLSKQIVFHTFLEKSPLIPFHIKIGTFIFMLSFDVSINALLYSNSNISKKYHSSQDLFSFTMSNNTLIIIISTFVSLVFMAIIIKLSKIESGIRNIFRKEESKIKKKKNYTTDYPTKMKIFEDVEKLLKIYKVKLIILIIFEFIILLFFLYFVTAFCQVYPKTQGSLLLNCAVSILIRFAIEVLICLVGAKLYTIAAHIDYEIFYKIMLFIYDFSC